MLGIEMRRYCNEKESVGIAMRRLVLRSKGSAMPSKAKVMQRTGKHRH